MDFYCTQEFYNTFKEFTKKTKFNLYSCKTDIPTAFPEGEISDNTYHQAILLNGMDKFDVYKLRITNSVQQSKSGGFRLYFALDKEYNSIVFLALLAKGGKKGKEKLDKKVYQNLLKSFRYQRDNGELIPLDLTTGVIKIK